MFAKEYFVQDYFAYLAIESVTVRIQLFLTGKITENQNTAGEVQSNQGFQGSISKASYLIAYVSPDGQVEGKVTEEFNLNSEMASNIILTGSVSAASLLGIIGSNENITSMVSIDEIFNAEFSKADLTAKYNNGSLEGEF